MEGRLSLDELLRNTFGSSVNYYFQPPTGTLLRYPALIYKLDTLQDLYSDNRVWQRRHVYSMILILDNPDNNLVDRIDDLPFCRMSAQAYTNDNLYHYPFTIYY